MPDSQTVNLRELPQALSAATKLPRDLGPLAQRLATYLQSIAAVPWHRQADPTTGTPWVPRKGRVGRRGGRGRLLQRTGALRQSIGVKVLPPCSLEWTWGPDYGRFHMTGTRRMPARPFVGFGPEARRQMDRIVADWAAHEVGR